jgi:hypothetical protein
MPHQDVTNTVQFEMRFYMGNNNAQNTLHALCATTPGLADLNDLGAVVDAWIETEWAPIASEDWTATEIVLTSLDSIDGPRRSIPISPAVPGEVAVDAMPANVTIAVKEDIGRRGRGTAGRVFWIGLAESQVNGNQIEALTQTAIVAALETLRTNVEALPNFEGLCVPHLQVAGIRPAVATADQVQAFVLTDVGIDTQKDRLPFHKKKKRLPVA